MATLVQRTPSMLSVDYYNPKDTSTMDADAEICRLFGSLNLAGFTPVQPQVVNEVKQPVHQEVPPAPTQHEEDDMSMTIESDMTTVTDGEGNIQFVETSPSTPPPQEEKAIEGCGLIHMLAAHYAPRLSRLHCITRDPDFNLLETILAHREQFVTFPYGHRTCSSALTKIAFEIERRNNEGQPYSDDPDIDMAIALHNEAWLMSGWYSK